MTPEGRLVTHIKKAVNASGGAVRKCSWEGRVGAPDLFIMYAGCHWFVECKAPGERPRVSQLREFSALRDLGGCVVLVFDNADQFDAWWHNARRYADLGAMVVSGMLEGVTIV